MFNDFHNCVQSEKIDDCKDFPTKKMTFIFTKALRDSTESVRGSVYSDGKLTNITCEDC